MYFPVITIDIHHKKYYGLSQDKYQKDDLVLHIQRAQVCCVLSNLSRSLENSSTTAQNIS